VVVFAALLIVVALSSDLVKSELDILIITNSYSTLMIFFTAHVGGSDVTEPPWWCLAWDGLLGFFHGPHFDLLDLVVDGQNHMLLIPIEVLILSQDFVDFILGFRIVFIEFIFHVGALIFSINEVGLRRYIFSHPWSHCFGSFDCLKKIQTSCLFSFWILFQQISEEFLI
jgi:hypothetical protein